MRRLRGLYARLQRRTITLGAKTADRERRGEERTMVKTEQETSQDTQMVQVRAEQDAVGAARQVSATSK